MEFKDVLKKMRQERHLTQTELAEKLGLSKRTIILYETGKREPNYDNFKKLEDFFHVSSTYLRGETDTNEYNIHTGINNLENTASFQIEYEKFTQRDQIALHTLENRINELLLLCCSVSYFSTDFIDQLSLIMASINALLKSYKNTEKDQNSALYINAIRCALSDLDEIIKNA